MINSNIPTGEIAYTLGFTDASHFSRVFKKFVGQTPKQYQQALAVAVVE